jgi:exodeoxyribonuclease VII large subunit
VTSASTSQPALARRETKTTAPKRVGKPVDQGSLF